MARDSITFACANPIPEIWPWDARDAGARIVATGRSDFPNQLNNPLVFPGIFRGALDERARTIADGMAMATALELAACAKEAGLSEERVVPRMDEWEVYPREAVATAIAAQNEGSARVARTPEEIHADVPYVFEGFGQCSQQPITRLSVGEARARLKQGAFAPGSMAPKVESAVEFVEATQRSAVITALGTLASAMNGRGGTMLHPGRDTCDHHAVRVRGGEDRSAGARHASS